MAKIIEHPVAGGHEFVLGEVLVGRLVWCCSDIHGSAGWWLEVPGAAAVQLYEVPTQLVGDLDRARREGESAATGFAQLMLSDQVTGLLAQR